MEPFTQHTGRFVTLDRANVDTDQIIPARVSEADRADRLWRLPLRWILPSEGGQPDPQFVLNRPEAAGACVLVARQNFGCGSSREHAVWAISQHGFRAVVAPKVGSTPGFADIFRQNSYKNGLLPVEVCEAFADRLFAAGTGTVDIDLEANRITAHCRMAT